MGDAVVPLPIRLWLDRKEALGHMKALQGNGTSRPWNRYVVLRVVLAVGTLVSLVLASGAGSHWH